MSRAQIHQLNVSDGGVPKRPVPEAELSRESGLSGDAHAKTQIHGGPERALSLYPLEAIERLSGEGHPIHPGSVGENVTTQGLDWAKVVPGTRLRLGSEVEIEIASFAAPCPTISGSFSDGDVSRLAERVVSGQSRVCARVLREGRLKAGDPIEILTEGVVSAPTRRNATMNSPTLGYVNLYVTDLERSVAFFEKTLGLELQFSDPGFGYASVSLGPVRMGLARVDPSDAAQARLVGRQTGIGLVVEDLESTHAELAGRGVVFTMEPSRQPWGGFMAMFADPDGNVFYLDQAES